MSWTRASTGQPSHLPTSLPPQLPGAHFAESADAEKDGERHAELKSARTIAC